MLTADQLQALTWLACETRRTTIGAAEWDKPGTHKAITDICGTWGFVTAVDHVIAHARDSKARTPYAMRGTKPNPEPTNRRPHPLRANDPEECRTHAGQHRDHCGPCASEAAPEPTYGIDPMDADTNGLGDDEATHAYDGLTGREFFAVRRQEMHLRNALEPKTETKEEAS